MFGIMQLVFLLPFFQLSLYADNESPEITDCPPSQYVDTEPGTRSSTIEWAEPSASDNAGNVTLTFNGPGTNGGDFEMGVTTVSYTAVDGSGKEAQCSFTIVVTGTISFIRSKVEHQYRPTQDLTPDCCLR